MSAIYHSQELTNIYQSLSVLNVLELDQVMNRILGLRREKMSSVLSNVESELLQKINLKIPFVIQKRYNFLQKRRNKEILNEKEYQELLELTVYIENFNVQRLQNLIELAKFRNVTLDEVIISLELKPILYVNFLTNILIF